MQKKIMNNKYKYLEDFLLRTISGFKFNWNLDSDTRPYELDFKNDEKPVSTIYVRFSHPNYNELDIQLSETNKGYKSIRINIDKVPTLMSHLSVAEYSFQLAARLELGENEFDEVSKYVDEVIKTGKFKGKLVRQDKKHSHVYYIDINEKQKIELAFPPINHNNLGFQGIAIHVNKPDNPNAEIFFRKFIPVHKIKNFPFLNSIVQVPQVVNKELNPDIDEFINYFSNLESEYLSPIAKVVELNMKLKEELSEEKNNKSKRLKI
jgi:hypothetical protein